MDFNYGLRPSLASARLGLRQLLFYSLLLSSLLGCKGLATRGLRSPLYTITRAPYRYKLSRHQLTLARSRLSLSLSWPQGGALVSLALLSSLGALMLSLSQVRFRFCARATEWWT